jgi:hypothetical protein
MTAAFTLAFRLLSNAVGYEGCANGWIRSAQEANLRLE